MERTALKVLLRQRHLQEHRAFCREYDRVARGIDRELVGTYPSKATFYRWLAGDLRGLPHPGHCRILEMMIPGWTVNAMFEPWEDDENSRAEGKSPVDSDWDIKQAGLAGVTAIYTSRSEFAHETSPHKLFDKAAHVDAAGISLNLLCQQYPDLKLRALLRRATVRLLFLDPEGEFIKARNHEEGHEEGHLSAWTDANLAVIGRLRDELDPEGLERVELRLYDQPVRFNLMFIDQHLGVMQPYLPAQRGLQSPTFVMQRQGTDGSDLYSLFAQIFSSLWEQGRPF